MKETAVKIAGGGRERHAFEAPVERMANSFWERKLELWGTTPEPDLMRFPKR